jgi:beta-lactamase superfamily II metal-dependent hydrolase
MKQRITLVACILFCISGLGAQNKSIYVSAQAEGDPLEAWSEGYLDIHNINTGCGNAAYCILPDGTTLLIDAGANSPSAERHVAPRPNKTKSPGEWITNYILKHAPQDREKKIDYFFATHFHKDHINGIIKVAEQIAVNKIVDRGYDLQKPEESGFFLDYLELTRRLKASNPNIVEKFQAGVNNQLVLKYDNGNRYAGKFEIRNLIGNGIMWTGVGTQTISLFPDLSGVSNSNRPEENSLSCAIKLSYGKFDYYNGGDLTGYPKPGRPSWHDLETPLAPKIGKVEVCNVNHHGYNNATNDVFIKTLAPQVFIIQASDALHPNHSTLHRMLAKQLYSDSRDVFATNLHPAAKVVIGDLTEQEKSTQGHIVIRVSPGGADYKVYVLNDSNDTYGVNAVYGPYYCR